MCNWDIAAAERLDPFPQVIAFVGGADPSIKVLLGIGQPLVEVVCVPVLALASLGCSLVLHWPKGGSVRHAGLLLFVLFAENEL
jgi:hypothetical protein